MKSYDLGNLLMMFDESLTKIMQHLEQGYPDRALIRAQETHKALRKLMDHCISEMHNHIERKL